MTAQSSDAMDNPITEDDIASYLVHTPDFFVRHAELLASVQFTSPYSNRAVSLQERQAEMLRERIKQLEQRVMDMVRHGKDNVILADKVSLWTESLLRNDDLRVLPRLLLAQLESLFAVPQVGLRLWGVAETYADLPWAAGVSEDARLFATSLVEPFCGLNSGFEAASWLADPARAASLALLPLRQSSAASLSPAFGLLVLASDDPQRFDASMGTDFLVRMGSLASAALGRLLVKA